MNANIYQSYVYLIPMQVHWTNDFLPIVWPYYTKIYITKKPLTILIDKLSQPSFTSYNYSKKPWATVLQ